jgi:hypothetical protein
VTKRKRQVVIDGENRGRDSGGQKEGVKWRDRREPRRERGRDREGKTLGETERWRHSKRYRKGRERKRRKRERKEKKREGSVLHILRMGILTVPSRQSCIGVLSW